MTKFKQTMIVLSGVAGLALSSMALAQLPKPLPPGPAPAPKPILAQPRLVSFGASHTCNGSGAQIQVVIEGGNFGTNGTVTVSKNALVGRSAFNVAANARSTVVVNTNMTNCHNSGFFKIDVAGTRLNATKWVEPASVNYKEATGPI